MTQHCWEESRDLLRDLCGKNLQLSLVRLRYNRLSVSTPVPPPPFPDKSKQKMRRFGRENPCPKQIAAAATTTRFAIPRPKPASKRTQRYNSRARCPSCPSLGRISRGDPTETGSKKLLSIKYLEKVVCGILGWWCPQFDVMPGIGSKATRISPRQLLRMYKYLGAVLGAPPPAPPPVTLQRANWTLECFARPTHTCFAKAQIWTLDDACPSGRGRCLAACRNDLEFVTAGLDVTPLDLGVLRNAEPIGNGWMSRFGNVLSVPSSTLYLYTVSAMPIIGPESGSSIQYSYGVHTGRPPLTRHLLVQYHSPADARDAQH